MMGEIIRMVEQVGIDIVLTGVFVLATFLFAWSIGSATTVAKGIRKAPRRLHSILTFAISGGARSGEATTKSQRRSKSDEATTESQEASKDVADRSNGDNRPRMSTVAGIGILVLAAMTGRVFTLIGDEVLDSDFIDAPVFLYLPPLDELNREWDDDSEWDDEDTLKRETLKDARDWSRFAEPIHDLLARHVDKSEADPPCGDSRNDCARGFFQHANAVIRARGNDETRAMLSREASLAEFLSVAFVSVWVLIFATLFGPVRRSLVKLIVSPRSKKLWGELARNIVFLAWLWIAEGFALRLWTEQTKLLDRRVIYSYLAIASEGDPAMMEAPPRAPAAAPTRLVDDSGS